MSQEQANRDHEHQSEMPALYHTMLNPQCHHRGVTIITDFLGCVKTLWGE